MTFETEAVLDRRRLRRRLSFWRVLAVTAGVLALGFLLFSSAQRAGLIEQRQIARVTIEGLITDDRDVLRLIKKIGESSKVAGVILFVNSPGGTTVGGEALFEALRELARVEAAGGRVRDGRHLGRLHCRPRHGPDRRARQHHHRLGGRDLPVARVLRLLEKLGIKVNEIKSGPLKANPSPFQPLDEPGKAAAEQMVAESQRWFVNLVRTRRGIDTSKVPGLEEGRVFSGRDALGAQADRPDRRRGRGGQIPGRSARRAERTEDRGLEGEPRQRLGVAAGRRPRPGACSRDRGASTDLARVSERRPTGKLAP